MKSRLVALFVFFAAVSAFAAPRTIIFVRHAEKVISQEKDPLLTDAGAARAKELARVLADANVKQIYTTPYHRTMDTATPLAKALGLTPIAVEVGTDFAKVMAAKLTDSAAPSTIAVVSHSNTIPDMLRALGITDAPEIPDSQYDDLYIVTIGEGAPRLLRLRYGTIARQ